jgi:CPA2 family monovalent cation:H+ antiporter-2
MILAAGASESTSVALAEIGIMLLALGILASVAVRLTISVVPMYLGVGLALGNGGIAPLNFSEDFLAIGAQLGAILLLLMLGLEHSGPNLVEGVRERKSTGLIDIAVNGIPGAIAGLLLGWGPVGALALGGITYVSSSGIAAQMMREFGWNRSEVSRRVTTVLVIEDLALAPYLPLLSTLVAGLGVVAGVISVGVALAVTVVALVISLKGQDAFGRILNTSSQGALLLTVFGIALAVAGFSEMVGFSSAVAAFLVGLILTGEVAEAVRRRLSPLRDLFAAIFFVFFGLGVNPADIPPVLPLAAALAALGIAGKMFVGWFIARGMSDPLAWKRAGAFLVPRGEFSILIAALAASTVFGPYLQALTMAYVLITSIAASLLLRFFRSGLERT